MRPKHAFSPGNLIVLIHLTMTMRLLFFILFLLRVFFLHIVVTILSNYADHDPPPISSPRSPDSTGEGGSKRVRRSLLRRSRAIP